MPSDVLFGRQARIAVGTTALVQGPADSGLRVVFDVTRTTKPEPNKAEIQIWGLSSDSRASLEGSSDIPVQIEAGYETPSLIFLGALKEASSRSEGPDIITTISSGDGAKALKKSRVSITIPRNTPIKTAIEQLAAAFGLKPGNLAEHAYQFQNGGTLLPNGAAIHGSAAWEMTYLLQACGKEWSVQNGEIQILDRNAALLGEAILLTPETGLIEQPSIKVDSKRKKQTLDCRMLMAPDVAPGRLLVLKSRHVSGNFRIETCQYNGDTHGNEWSIGIEALAL